MEPSGRPRARPSRSPYALYVGVALFALLAAFTARAIAVAWQARSGEARASAIFDLVEQRTAPRPTDAPGAMAWLRLQLDRFADQARDAETRRLFRSLLDGAEVVPPSLAPVARAIGSKTDAGRRFSIPDTLSERAPRDATGTLRVERVVPVDGRLFVLSRRARLERDDAAARASNAFAADAIARAMAAAAALDPPTGAVSLPVVGGSAPTRVVRIYAVSEDGTLVSMPSPQTAPSAEAERRLLATRPWLPTFAPEEFFFRSWGSGTDTRASYSGFYLDLGGRGLVSTVLAPFTEGDGSRGVMAVDLAFALDWPAFAASVSPPMQGAAARTAAGPAADWPTLATSLGGDAPDALARAVSQLARGSAVATADPIRHAVVDRVGTVTAFYVADGQWLLMLFPASAPAFPVAAVALLVVLLGALLAGFEFNRRRADTERAAALRAFDEKQNLLNTMQVPLVVVDPNTDVIAASNRAAEAIGIRAGATFGDLVWPDDAARAHYMRMQVASPEPRRAYGVPVRVSDGQGGAERRFALVRSVAVTAPIESLSADERHRLGILFLVDPDADLALVTSEVERDAAQRERQRLAGLLSHGVDTLARVLEHLLRRGPASTPADVAFAAWLAEYLERRLQVTAWLLDHWDAAAPLPHDTIVDAGQARTTAERLVAIFDHVRRDRELRARLHWDNGTLAEVSDDAGRLPDVKVSPPDVKVVDPDLTVAAPDPMGAALDLEVRPAYGREAAALGAGASTPPVDLDIDWPEAFVVTTPVRGGFGFCLGEALTNAVRHGLPGTRPMCRIRPDRVRRELEVEIRNDCAPDAAPGGEPYGGLHILTAIARLFDWRELSCEATHGTFVVRWRMPAGVRPIPGEAD